MAHNKNSNQPFRNGADGDTPLPLGYQWSEDLFRYEQGGEPWQPPHIDLIRGIDPDAGPDVVLPALHAALAQIDQSACDCEHCRRGERNPLVLFADAMQALRSSRAAAPSQTFAEAVQALLDDTPSVPVESFEGERGGDVSAISAGQEAVRNVPQPIQQIETCPVSPARSWTPAESSSSAVAQARQALSYPLTAPTPIRFNPTYIPAATQFHPSVVRSQSQPLPPGVHAPVLTTLPAARPRAALLRRRVMQSSYNALQSLGTGNATPSFGGHSPFAGAPTNTPPSTLTPAATAASAAPQAPSTPARRRRGTNVMNPDAPQPKMVKGPHSYSKMREEIDQQSLLRAERARREREGIQPRRKRKRSSTQAQETRHEASRRSAPQPRSQAQLQSAPDSESMANLDPRLRPSAGQGNTAGTSISPSSTETSRRRRPRPSMPVHPLLPGRSQQTQLHTSDAPRRRGVLQRNQPGASGQDESNKNRDDDEDDYVEQE